MTTQDAPRRPRFALGQVVATPGALALLDRARVSPLSVLARHLRGDWGAVDAHDASLNELAVLAGSRILSSYEVRDESAETSSAAAERLWFITEADRSVTTLLLPSEY